MATAKKTTTPVTAKKAATKAAKTAAPAKKAVKAAVASALGVGTDSEKLTELDINVGDTDS